MNLLSLKFAAIGLTGLFAVAGNAQATGLYDNDRGFAKFPSHHQDDYAFEDYCEEHPYNYKCKEYRKELREERRHYHKKKKRVKKAHNPRCRALIRAVGKRNVVKVFARNSARFAWRRETRAVHGRQFSNWNNAHNARISCSRHGLLFSCTARGTPCR